MALDIRVEDLIDDYAQHYQVSTIEAIKLMVQDLEAALAHEPEALDVD